MITRANLVAWSILVAFVVAFTNQFDDPTTLRTILMTGFVTWAVAQTIHSLLPVLHTHTFNHHHHQSGGGIGGGKTTTRGAKHA